jgi:hypothetical protein
MNRAHAARTTASIDIARGIMLMPGAPTAHTHRTLPIQGSSRCNLNAVRTTTPLLCTVVDYLLRRHVATHISA